MTNNSIAAARSNTTVITNGGNCLIPLSKGDNINKKQFKCFLNRDSRTRISAASLSTSFFFFLYLQFSPMCADGFLGVCSMVDLSID